jgi:hypothetical protein
VSIGGDLPGSRRGPVVVFGHLADNQTNVTRIEEVMADRGTGSNSQRTRDRGIRATSNAAEIRESLTTRRSRITPETAGLPLYGRIRRVPGLRRDDVALLAGISDIHHTKRKLARSIAAAGE